MQDYTVSDTNWNRYSLTFTGDSTGTWLANAGIGIRLRFGLASGSNFLTGTTGSWLADDMLGSTNMVNFMDSTSNDWFLSGCQVEIGSVATDFEHRSYAQELALCERYYQIIKPTLGECQHSTNIQGCLRANPPMRATPTASILNNSNNINMAGSGADSVTSIGTIYYNGTTGGWAEMGGSGFTQHRNYFILGDKFAFSAEL